MTNIITNQKIVIRLFIFFLTLLFVQKAEGQINKEKAVSKAQEAIKLMDNGKIDESIILLDEAQKLDPERIDYSYEIALAYYMRNDFKNTIAILEKYIDHKNVTEQFFQLLGNSYDALVDTNKAIEAYDLGLKKFPNSGMIILEKGNVYWNNKNYLKALYYYEKGIETDPDFASNYYRATLIYCKSSEKVWGMIYGEIFMNLERNTKRTEEISKILYDTYKSSILIENDTAKRVIFNQENRINANDLSENKKFNMPMGMIYETTILLSILNTKNIDINSLDSIRTLFINIYNQMGYNNSHPNILFDYQNKILKAGHLEAYNHWILMKGDEDNFDKWLSKNKDKWDNFVSWFRLNSIVVNNSMKYNSSQY